MADSYGDESVEVIGKADVEELQNSFRQDYHNVID